MIGVDGVLVRQDGFIAVAGWWCDGVTLMAPSRDRPADTWSHAAGKAAAQTTPASRMTASAVRCPRVQLGDVELEVSGGIRHDVAQGHIALKQPVPPGWKVHPSPL